MNDLLLSICIPTYDRAPYLEKCLKAIFNQVNDTNKHSIEVFVSNNASPDNTTEVVNEFTSNGHNIIYNVNPQNLGVDVNVSTCFKKANGKYVWIFADDDFILPGFLDKILELLRNNEIGLLYLSNIWYYNESEISLQNNLHLDYSTYQDPLVFLNNVNYWITFCSANIINKSILKDEEWIDRFKGTNLVQLSWTIPVIFKSLKNIIINDKVIACKAGNTGGYKLYKVFGSNFNLIMDKFIEEGLNRDMKKIINNHLLKTFFPTFIVDRTSKFNNEKYFRVLFPIFWSYKEFWKNIVPLSVKPYRNRFHTGIVSFLKRTVASFFYQVINSKEYITIIETKHFHQRKIIENSFKIFGDNSMLPEMRVIKNPQYISIGSNFVALQSLRIEAWDEYAGQKFSPKITIGNNVIFNTDVHIGCINKVIIGNNVMLASRIYISDHSHGEVTKEALALSPSLRPLVSKGPVIIEDNVWIGEGACILPGVTIGKNAIIGANSVVTFDVPSNSVAAGVPAKILKLLQ